MKIGGLQKVSLIDFPGIISCVIFTQGCNFRCRYCHNPQLVYPELFKEEIPEDIIFEYLKKRKGMLDGVVITGGEPTIHSDILDFIKEIKKIGYKIKLNTNGSKPEVLQEIIPFLDYVAMDIKTSLDDVEYSKVCGVKVNLEKIIRSIELVINSKISFEFRTTIDENFIDHKRIEEIQNFLNYKYGGIISYKIQKTNKFFKGGYYYV